MLFNSTFNISLISWRSVLLVEETTDLLQVTDKLYYIMLYTSPWSRFELTTSVVIGTDCIGSCKSNYHTITATTAPCRSIGFKKQSTLLKGQCLQFFFSVVVLQWSVGLNIEKKKNKNKKKVVNPTTIRSQPQRPPVFLQKKTQNLKEF
jgi:hypothetical protein